MKARIIYFSVLLIMAGFFSQWLAKNTYATDFPAFYRVAHIALDSSRPISDIYRIDDRDFAQYGIPENEGFVEYRYSVLVAYLISPLALLDFYSAKGALILINLLSYATSVIVILQAFGLKGRRLLYPWAISFVWMPFIQNIRFGQTNALILLLITIAIVLSQERRNIPAGFFMGAASLFKPFSLPVTMVLCIKEWRIIPGYLIAMGSALLLPGTTEWFNSFLWPPHALGAYSFFYRLLLPINEYLFWICALMIGTLTALITYRNRQKIDIFATAALSIPAAFLCMPVLETTHLAILIFSFAYLVARDFSIRTKVLATVSFLMVNVGSINDLWGGSLMFIGVLSTWITMLYMVECNCHEPANNRMTELFEKTC